MKQITVYVTEATHHEIKRLATLDDRAVSKWIQLYLQRTFGHESSPDVPAKPFPVIYPYTPREDAPPFPAPGPGLPDPSFTPMCGSAARPDDYFTPKGSDHEIKS